MSIDKRFKFGFDPASHDGDVHALTMVNGDNEIVAVLTGDMAKYVHVAIEAYEAAKVPDQPPMGKRVMYEDGTPSREYDDQPVELYKIIYRVLNGHKMIHQKMRDTDIALPLVDYLTPEGWTSINGGMEENEAIAEAIVEAISGSTKREIVSPAIPSEAMCDRARGFIIGLDLLGGNGQRTWGNIKSHLEMGGYPSCARIDTQAEVNPMGHITKWDVAECIYVLMNTPEIEDAKS